MVYGEENREEAKKHIGKKVIVWSDYSTGLGGNKQGGTNIYTAILDNVRATKKYFVIESRSLELYKDLNRPFGRLGTHNCFQFFKLFEQKDENGNFLLDF